MNFKNKIKNLFNYRTNNSNNSINNGNNNDDGSNNNKNSEDNISSINAVNDNENINKNDNNCNNGCGDCDYNITLDDIINYSNETCDNFNKKLEQNEKDKKEGYSEIITTIGDLKNGDKVLCTDGIWREIKVLPIIMPKTMYKMYFENGTVKCSGDHLWTLFDSLNNPFILQTDDIFNNFDTKNHKNNCNNYNYSDDNNISNNLSNINLKELPYCYGKPNGPKLLNIEKINPEPCRCIHILDSNDHLFEILLDTSKINKENMQIEIE